LVRNDSLLMSATTSDSAAVKEIVAGPHADGRADPAQRVDRADQRQRPAVEIQGGPGDEPQGGEEQDDRAEAVEHVLGGLVDRGDRVERLARGRREQGAEAHQPNRARPEPQYVHMTVRRTVTSGGR
jgi:hypothetical protein